MSRVFLVDGVNGGAAIIVFLLGELPIYHRLDLSSTYNFKMSKHNKLRGKIGLSIRNIYNRKNLISKEYRQVI